MEDVALWWIGLVWAVFCGWAVSSYTSNFIFRLPLKEYPFGRKPYCDSCDTLLQPRDLFPIFSYFMTDGKCRYCGAAVPKVYYIIELIYPLIFMQLYFCYGFGDQFLLAALAAAALVVLVMTRYQSNYFSPMTLLFLAVLGLLWQVLTTAELMTPLLNIVTAFVLAVAWHRLRSGEKTEIDLRQLPPEVWMAGTLGCWLAVPQALLAAGLWALLNALLKCIWQSPARSSLAFALSLMTLLLA